MARLGCCGAGVGVMVVDWIWVFLGLWGDLKRMTKVAADSLDMARKNRAAKVSKKGTQTLTTPYTRIHEKARYQASIRGQDNNGGGSRLVCFGVSRFRNHT